MAADTHLPSRDVPTQLLLLTLPPGQQFSLFHSPTCTFLRCLSEVNL